MARKTKKTKKQTSLAYKNKPRPESLIQTTLGPSAISGRSLETQMPLAEEYCTTTLFSLQQQPPTIQTSQLKPKKKNLESLVLRL